MGACGIRTGDEVLVITGEDGPQGGRAGRRGRVLRVLPKKDKVVVEGINIAVKHRKPGRRMTPTQLQTGRIEMPAPIHVSNVRLVCPRCEKVTAVVMVRTQSGHRVRQCRKCHENLEAA